MLFLDRSIVRCFFSRCPIKINSSQTLTSPTLSSCASSIIFGDDVVPRGQRGRSEASCFPGDAPMLGASRERSKSKGKESERRRAMSFFSLSSLLSDLDLFFVSSLSSSTVILYRIYRIAT